MKFVFGLLLLMSVTAQARWRCNGPCTLEHSDGNTQYITVEAEGDTLSSAISAAQNRCFQYNNGNVSAFPAITSTDCRELAKPKPSTYRIIFKNSCGKYGTVHTAISYFGTDGDWKYDGFWSLDTGKTAIVAFTKNRVFYIHGHTNGFAQSWGKGSGPWEVRNEMLNFGEQRIPEDWATADYVFNFNCN